MKATKIKTILGNNIKHYRLLLGYTQEKLAEKCDLSPRYISYIENGKGNISIDTLEKLSIALNVDPDILIKKLS